MGCRMAGFRERCAIHEAAHATAALILGVPLVSISDNDTPHMHRGRYRPPHDCGLETMVMLWLSGPAAEELFFGSITDDGDLADYEMAREYLSRGLDPLHAAAELSRCRAAAERLVRSAWAQQRIRLLADALLRCGTLSVEEIHRI
jgi:hypothetical protein